MRVVNFSIILLHTFYDEVGNWRVLLIEAGQDASHIMDIPFIAQFLQASSAINWKYKTMPMNNFCLGK